MRVRNMGLTAAGAVVAVMLIVSGCSAPAAEETGASTTPRPDTTATTPDPSPTETAQASDLSPIETYAELERAALVDMPAEYAELYSDVSVEVVEPSEIIFTYVFAAAVGDLDTSAETLAGLEESLQTLCDTQVFPAMEATGVPPEQKVTYIYYDSDGTEIWRNTFTPS